MASVRYCFFFLVNLSGQHPAVDATYVHRESDAESNDAVDSMTDRSRLIASITLSVRYFEYRHVRYIWNHTEGSFVRLFGLDKGHLVNKFTREYLNGITKDEQIGRRTVYGSNSVDVEVKSYGTLFIQEVM